MLNIISIGTASRMENEVIIVIRYQSINNTPVMRTPFP